jgi:hypothetical protein
MLALIAVGVLVVAVGVAWAVSSNGPYYALPAWDQKLPASTRFVVLTDWSSQAVLDRETGLVWEQAPSATLQTWSTALNSCANLKNGGRMGWRLPSVHELSSLIDPTVTPSGTTSTLPVGHPFTNVVGTFYWSATTYAPGPTVSWRISFFGGQVATLGGKGNAENWWCVRGGMNADAY